MWATARQRDLREPFDVPIEKSRIEKFRDWLLTAHASIIVFGTLAILAPYITLIAEPMFKYVNSHEIIPCTLRDTYIVPYSNGVYAIYGEFVTKYGNRNITLSVERDAPYEYTADKVNFKCAIQYEAIETLELPLYMWNENVINIFIISIGALNGILIVAHLVVDFVINKRTHDLAQQHP